MFDDISGRVEEDISITLTSAGTSPALQVETRNGTAFLVLVRPLDREGVAGPASLSTSLLCQRLKMNTQDPGFLIPLTVRWVLGGARYQDHGAILIKRHQYFRNI